MEFGNYVAEIVSLLCLFRDDGVVSCLISVTSILYDLCSAHHGDILHFYGLSSMVPAVFSHVSWRFVLNNLDC